MKKTVVAMMLLGAMLVPSAALAQTDDPSTDRATQAEPVEQPDLARDTAERDLDLDRVKEHALEAIAKRVEALSKAIERLGENQHVTAEHARTLIDDYEFHIRGLEALVAPIEAAESLAELRPLVESIVHEHWVFALQIPKGALTVASDSIIDATGHFASAYERLSNVLAALAEQGIELPEAEELLAESERLTNASAELVTPIPDTVLAITVEEMPEARSTIEAAREDVRSAHANLVEARENVQEIIRIIKEVIRGDRATDAA